MNVIIIGLNHYNTLGLIWSLGDAGHKITLLLNDCKHDYVSKSKYVLNTIIIKNEDRVIDVIKKVVSEMEEKPVVFPSNDVYATLLNNHYADLIDICFFENGGANGLINRYRNKDVGNRLALECGFVLPNNYVIKKFSELNIHQLLCPVLIKANNSVHGGKSAMKKCNTQNEVGEFVKGLPNTYFPIQVQEFIEKEFEIMLLGCSLYGGKRVYCPVANKKTRQYPKYVGAGSWSESIEIANDSALKELSEKVTLYMQRIGYTGNFSAEFLYSKGKFYFLEINLRNDGTSWLSTKSGYNLPDMVCRSFVEEDILLDSNSFKKMNFMNIGLDFHYVKEGEVKLKDWIKQFNRQTCYSHYNKKDCIPFWTFIFFSLFEKTMS